MWAALTTAFFFLLRAREYFSSGKVDLEQVVRGKDLALRAHGRTCRPGKADQVDTSDRA